MAQSKCQGLFGAMGGSNERKVEGMPTMPTKAWNSETIRWLLSAEHSELLPTEAQRPGGSFEVLGMRKDSNEQNPSNLPRSRTSSKAEAQAEDTREDLRQGGERTNHEQRTEKGGRLGFRASGGEGGGLEAGTPTTGPNGLGCPEVLSRGVGWGKAEGSQEQPHTANFFSFPERIRLLADCARCACHPNQSCMLTHTRPMPRM